MGDVEIDKLKARIAELDAVGRSLLAIVDEFHEYCDREDRPCGDPDAECSIGMGEWVSKEDRALVVIARAALGEKP